MSLGHRLKQTWLGLTSRTAATYWERRYQTGMDSGSGSRGELAAFKAKVLNELVTREKVQTVIELGCGDGQQLALANYPSYLGLDVSATAIDLCRSRFVDDATRAFLWYDPARSVRISNFLQADLTLSLDVIYHLLEDHVYHSYLRDLFALSRRWVVVYSSDKAPERTAPHVKHRKFTQDVTTDHPAFELREVIRNPYPELTFADFYIFERTNAGNG
jgi:SAM-dependent methyltransferase